MFVVYVAKVPNFDTSRTFTEMNITQTGGFSIF